MHCDLEESLPAPFAARAVRSPYADVRFPRQFAGPPVQGGFARAQLRAGCPGFGSRPWLRRVGHEKHPVPLRSLFGPSAPTARDALNRPGRATAAAFSLAEFLRAALMIAPSKARLFHALQRPPC